MDTKVQETEGFGEENSGKKKSKFKTFKKFFGKRKRKETLSSESGSLKLCQSTSDVTASQSMHTDDDSEDELEIHTNTMGSRALSHDSIFISDAVQEPARASRVFSQENVSDRIRALQLKLQQNWKLGMSSPFGTPSKRVDDGGVSSEDDGLPRSPPETSLLQEILNSSTVKFSDSHKHLSSLSLAGTGSEEEEQVSLNPLRSRFIENHLFPMQSSAKIVALQIADNSLSPPADFDAPPEFSAFLDNSAAKHKLLVKPRNQRASKIRRPPSINVPDSQNYLSNSHEKDERERKEMPAKLIYESNCSSHQEVIESTVYSVNVKQVKTAKGIQHNLDHQDEETCTLHSASELDLPAYRNNPDNCNTVQKLLYMIPSSSGPKEDMNTLNPTGVQELQREKKNAETLKASPGNLSGTSLSILSQEKKPIHDVPSKNDILPDDLAKNDGLPSLDGADKIVLKDTKTLVEDICNKGSSLLPNSSNLSPKSPSQFIDVSSSENSNASQTSCIAPSSQTDRPSLAVDKVKPTDELPVSNKEVTVALPSVLILGVETEKEASELSPLRKFSVSSARERPRPSSVNIRATLCESPLNRQALQTKIKDFSKNETVKEDVQVRTFQEKKNSINTQASPSELEVADQPVADAQIQIVSSKPVLSDSSPGLPQQSCTDQSGGEEKNPFQVKLRSTSLSMKYKDNSSQESKEVKRYSAELNLEKKGLSSSSPKSEKAEIKKTADANIGGFLNENLRVKTKSVEQSSTKPPLPRKPVLQHFVIPGTNTCPEKQEKGIKYPELKNEDPVLEKKHSPSEVPEKNIPSPVMAADTARETESQTVPSWITIAKQKQKVAEQELSREEKPVAADKADAEKQIKEKEKVEEPVRQQTDFARNTFLPFPPTVASEEQKKDTKSDLQEPLPKASLLSLSHNSSAQSSVPAEKEDIKPIKKEVHSSPDQPSWMELAKKKSQAWSDMPQMIK